MSQADHIVPAMPKLALLADNGGIVTVNPEWCDWYEQVFNVPAGAGYIKGREIMHQIDGEFSELFRVRSEAVKSTIHSMISNDPNRPTMHFNNIAEARKSYESAGKHAMDFDEEEQVFNFDGYFSVKDMEAILFIRRAEELIGKAKQQFSGFFAGAENVEELDINQLMQVMSPALERTDVDSQIFAAPVSASSNRAAMFPAFNRPRSVWCSLSGKLNLTGCNTTPPELQEGDVFHRTHISSDNRVFHITHDGNGDQAFYICDSRGNLLMVQREPKGTRSRQWAGILEDAQEGLDIPPNDQLPMGNARLNQLLTEGGGLRRGEWPGEVAARTAINRTTVVGGTRIHCFEEGDDDFPMLSSLLKKLESFGEEFAELVLSDMRLEVGSVWADDSVLYFKKEDGHFSLVSEHKITGQINHLFSLKVAEFSTPPGQIVIFEHKPSIVSYDWISRLLEAFNTLSLEKVRAAVAAVKAERGQ
jgi:hypothetical protein